MKHSLSRPIVAVAPCVVALLSGCASVMNETTQPMKIETRNADGSYVVGVECRISNDFGVLTSHSGDTAMVRRSSMDLDIVCRHPNSSADNDRPGHFSCQCRSGRQLFECGCRHHRGPQKGHCIHLPHLGSAHLRQDPGL